MPSGQRTITLPTIDHGDVTIPEPEWCAGHADHDPNTARTDLAHASAEVPLTFRGHTLSAACLVQDPFAEKTSRQPYASELLYGRKLDAAGLYTYAAALDAYADQLRDLADRLDTLLRGGAR
ncbi:hypothetical protein DMT42_13195 [Streptomyces actuosus]|uniref:Uncharacterized protein n=2 Tax=Streptomyces TaxID=1883 RepID=A0A2U9P115_STRAS|nr:hypothetical protein DMT42_13195 [Streptomyces actuosus]